MGLGKNYGRRAFRAAKGSYSPPTTYLAHPTKKGEYITKAEDIHDHFIEAWTKVYRTHPQDSDVWENFKDKYAEHIPKAEYNDLPYTAEEFIQQLEKMKETAAGFDGWTRKALKLLPRKAWEDRAKIENLATELGILPDAYLHVPLPMLPKGQAIKAEQHRCITIFSMIHRVVYGAMWNRLKTWQEIGSTRRNMEVAAKASISRTRGTYKR